MIRYIDWIWVLQRLIVALVVLFVAWLLFGCAVSQTPKPIEQTKVVTKIPDPLETDRNQKESVAMYLKKYGQPTLFWSYSDGEFKFEVYYWPQSKPERWACKVNGTYRLTWTQLRLKEETQDE